MEQYQMEKVMTGLHPTMQRIGNIFSWLAFLNASYGKLLILDTENHRSAMEGKEPGTIAMEKDMKRVKRLTNSGKTKREEGEDCTRNVKSLLRR